jgi:hypothetical protein
MMHDSMSAGNHICSYGKSPHNGISKSPNSIRQIYKRFTLSKKAHPRLYEIEADSKNVYILKVSEFRTGGLTAAISQEPRVGAGMKSSSNYSNGSILRQKLYR